MKKLALTLLFLAACAMAIGQTAKITRHKASVIFALKQIKVGYSVTQRKDSLVKNDVVLSTDSVLHMLSNDPWFSSLSDSSKHYRIVRIKMYEGICMRKDKVTGKRRTSQDKFLPGWVDRALIPRPIAKH